MHDRSFGVQPFGKVAQRGESRDERPVADGRVDQPLPPAEGTQFASVELDREQEVGPRLISGHAVGDAPFVAGLAALRDLAKGLNTERSVVHSDLSNRNVLVDGDRITAVFNWGCAMYGDFLRHRVDRVLGPAALAELDIRARARAPLRAAMGFVPTSTRACMPAPHGLDWPGPWNAIARRLRDPCARRSRARRT